MKLTLSSLVVWINKTGVELIWMNCMWKHFTVRGTVWSGTLAFGIIGPYFFEDEIGNAVTVTSDRYVLYGKWVLASRVTPLWHRPCHLLVTKRWSNSTYCLAVDEHLKNCVWKSHISLYSDISCPAFSPDVSAYEFFAWGSLKSKVFQARPADLHNHKQRISDGINAIPPATLLRVMECVLNRVYQCIKIDGRHLTGVMIKK
jgi:hypothetical protein